MSISNSELLDLPASEKLRIIEMLWDQLGASAAEIPLPEWVEEEGQRRLNQMNSDPEIGREHQEVWKKIGSRHG
jgi:putative addiction module component (TIGR02574 family)